MKIRDVETMAERRARRARAAAREAEEAKRRETARLRDLEALRAWYEAQRADPKMAAAAARIADLIAKGGGR